MTADRVTVNSRQRRHARHPDGDAVTPCAGAPNAARRVTSIAPAGRPRAAAAGSWSRDAARAAVPRGVVGERRRPDRRAGLQRERAEQHEHRVERDHLEAGDAAVAAVAAGVAPLAGRRHGSGTTRRSTVMSARQRPEAGRDQRHLERDPHRVAARRPPTRRPRPRPGRPRGPRRGVPVASRRPAPPRPTRGPDQVNATP